MQIERKVAWEGAWSLGDFHFDTPWILAPLAGYTNWPFQVLCRHSGAVNLTFTPMICAQALAFLSSRSTTLRLLDWDDSCGPAAVQLFGANPQHMAAAARKVVALGARLIDINMGCTVPKVVNKHCGAAMMRYPEEARAVVTAVREAVDVPITVKTRLGYHPGDGLGLKLALQMQELGVSAIFLHGRYADQVFSGNVHFDEAAAFCKALSIPVIANGDVLNWEDAQRWLSCGFKAVMVGRGAVGDPWIWERLERGRQGLAPLEHPRLGQILPRVQEHWDLVRHYTRLKETQAVQSFRCHLAYYCRKHRRLLPWRPLLLAAHRYGELEEVFERLASKIHEADNLAVEASHD